MIIIIIVTSSSSSSSSSIKMWLLQVNKNDVDEHGDHDDHVTER